jgi:hypothetical protein
MDIDQFFESFKVYTGGVFACLDADDFAKAVDLYSSGCYRDEAHFISVLASHFERIEAARMQNAAAMVALSMGRQPQYVPTFVPPTDVETALAGLSFGA